MFLGHAKSDTFINSQSVKNLFCSNTSLIRQIKLYSESRHALLRDVSVQEVLEDVCNWLSESFQTIGNKSNNGSGGITRRLLSKSSDMDIE
jgi:hypothetical protein